jgi:thiamine-phosphate pyrophosphorylase
MRMKRKIENGIYLVVDPSMEELLLLKRIELALREGITALQIWDNFEGDTDISAFINKVCQLCQPKNVPVLINNRWQYLKTTTLDGVHFDKIPIHYDDVRKAVEREFISGLTCNNDLTWVQWADANNFDYISFCSVFPSSTRTSCELVSFDTIKEAAKISSLPIFLAGGIKPENLSRLEKLDYSGIAVISGVMNTDRPDISLKAYRKNLKTKQT